MQLGAILCTITHLLVIYDDVLVYTYWLRAVGVMLQIDLEFL